MEALAETHRERALTAAEFPDEYEGAEGNLELVDGKVVDMGRTTLAHGIMVGALMRAIYARLAAGFLVVPASVAVIPNEGTARLPDLLVIPAEQDGKALHVDDPVLLAEVLSVSTTHVDFGAKTREYLGLATLQHYLIIEQDARSAWLWTRKEDGSWPEEPDLFDSSASISLSALDISFPMSELR